MHLLGRHAFTVVLHFQHRQVAFRVTEKLQPDLALGVLLGAVAQAVLHQVGQHLGQLVRVHAGLQGAAEGGQVQGLVGAG
ncbi:hypothetical protein D3C77_705400 [compost metagenome]